MNATAKQTARILIADDDRDHCLAVRAILEHDGHQVFEAHDGQSAIDKVLEERPDLVILDSLLPNKPGLECLRFIKTHPELQSLPVLICSGKGDLEYVLECSEAGACGFVHKPYEPYVLSDRVLKTLRGQ